MQGSRLYVMAWMKMAWPCSPESSAMYVDEASILSLSPTEVSSSAMACMPSSFLFIPFLLTPICLSAHFPLTPLPSPPLPSLPSLQVRLIDFSPAEQFLVTYSSHEPANPRDTQVRGAPCR